MSSIYFTFFYSFLCDDQFQNPRKKAIVGPFRQRRAKVRGGLNLEFEFLASEFCLAEFQHVSNERHLLLPFSWKVGSE